MFGGGPPLGGGRPGGGPMGRFRRSLGSDPDHGQHKIYDVNVVKRLPKYLSPVKSWLVLGTCGMLVRTLAGLAAPYLVAVATDNFIQTGNIEGLNIIVILFIGAALLVWAGQYVETLSLSCSGQSILFRLRTELFDHLQRLSMGFFDRSKVGEIMSRMQNDVQQLQQLLTSGVLNIFTNILTLLGIACAMLIMNPRLALLTLTILPVLCVLVLIWQRYARRAFSRARQTIATVNVQLQEDISGVRVTQSLSREGINIKQFDNINRANLNANIDATRLTAVMMPTAEILNAVATALVIIFGGYQVMEGDMGVGVLMGFLLYIQRFFRPIMELTMEYTELQRAIASGARIFESLDEKPDIIDIPGATDMPAIKGEIRFNHVSFSYVPGIEVLHDIHFTIHPGESVAIVGQTGAGKSSIANLIARFYDIEKGEVTIDDLDVRYVTQQSLRRQVGIVPQDPFLFSGTIEDNILYGNTHAGHEDVVKAAGVAGAHDIINHLERGYETQVGERGGNLSAGQRQLICLARVILSDPPVLILDEATSSVDSNTERLMQQALLQLSRRRTCIIIAHRLSTVTNSNRIIVLDHGRIAEIGSHQELMERQGLYHKMFMTLNSPDQVHQGA
ncbi:ABC transporter ATP-binding protein [Thermodesulfobacteriota bacterium]